LVTTGRLAGGRKPILPDRKKAPFGYREISCDNAAGTEGGEGKLWIEKRKVTKKGEKTKPTSHRNYDIKD